MRARGGWTRPCATRPRRTRLCSREHEIAAAETRYPARPTRCTAPINHNTKPSTTPSHLQHHGSSRPLYTSPEMSQPPPPYVLPTLSPATPTTCRPPAPRDERRTRQPPAPGALLPVFSYFVHKSTLMIDKRLPGPFMISVNELSDYKVMWSRNSWI